jgi:general stress protein 26
MEKSEGDQHHQNEKLKHDLWAKLSASPYVMIGLQGEHAEPLMAQLDADLHNTIYFFVGKTNRMVKGGATRATFASKGHDYFASMIGHSEAVNEPAMVDKLWNSTVEAWFPGGKGDVALLRFHISDAELWGAEVPLTTKVKMVFGGKAKCPYEAGGHAHVNDTGEHK